MRAIEIIVMGKTGAGKSTLINAVLEENLAPTGIGRAVTRENKIYKKKIMLPTDEYSTNHNLIPWEVSMYDTVGLEIDSTITYKTLEETKKHIVEARSSLNPNDISVVWFCVSEISKRFEPFELDLIKKLSIDYEIPFVAVITQSISKKKGDLEKQIEKTLPDVPLVKVLAKEYPIDNNVSVPPRGVDALLKESINNYHSRKIKILESKIDQLYLEKNEYIRRIEKRGRDCIHNYSKIATKIGILPGGCIPFVHGICIKMMMELNDIVGIKGDKSLTSDIFENAIVGMVATPFMLVPLLSVAVVQAYVETVGESYLMVLLTVVDKSTDIELKDNALMIRRIKNEITRIKK